VAQINGRYVIEPKKSQRAEISDRVIANLTLSPNNAVLKAAAIQK
jgi:hypothetical protein